MVCKINAHRHTHRCQHSHGIVTCTVCSLFWKMLKSLAVILSPAYDTGEACESVCYYCEKDKGPFLWL